MRTNILGFNLIILGAIVSAQAQEPTNKPAVTTPSGAELPRPPKGSPLVADHGNRVLWLYVDQEWSKDRNGMVMKLRRWNPVTGETNEMQTLRDAFPAFPGDASFVVVQNG